MSHYEHSADADSGLPNDAFSDGELKLFASSYHSMPVEANREVARGIGKALRARLHHVVTEPLPRELEKGLRRLASKERDTSIRRDAS